MWMCVRAWESVWEYKNSLWSRCLILVFSSVVWQWSVQTTVEAGGSVSSDKQTHRSVFRLHSSPLWGACIFVALCYYKLGWTGHGLCHWDPCHLFLLIPSYFTILHIHLFPVPETALSVFNIQQRVFLFSDLRIVWLFLEFEIWWTEVKVNKCHLTN